MVKPAPPAHERAALAETVDALRRGNLRVHALTSPVAAERTANTLLALNVRPTLTVDADDIAAFVASADALLINLGMMDPIRAAAIPRAIAAARAAGKPWVLDPVFVEVSGRRRDLALDCLASAPAVLKTNTAEQGLAAAAPAGTVCVTTGATDVVSQGARTLRIANGHPLAGRVTAMGCALGAVIAAAVAAGPDAFTGASAAVALYGIAGDMAGTRAAGPGSFAAGFLDALSTIDGAHLIRHARLS